MASRLRIGVVGTGFGSRVQIPTFQAHPRVEVVAIAGWRLEKARAVAERFNIPRVCVDDAELIGLDLDLVSIATPPFLHRGTALRALAAGRHVLCEKPMALSATEAEEMLRVARDAGPVHLVDHELRFNPNRRKVKTLIDEGFVGRPHHVLVTAVGPIRMMPWDWWSDAAQGGGMLGAQGSHQIDLLRYWLGETTAVSGLLHTFLTERPDPDTKRPHPVTSDDFTMFNLRFASGAIASVVVSAAAAQARAPRLEVWGDEGTLILDDERLLGARRGGAFEEMTERETASSPPGMDFPELWGLSFVYFVDHLSRVLLDGAPVAPAATFEDGVQVQRVMDAVHASAHMGWISIPPPA